MSENPAGATPLATKDKSPADDSRPSVRTGDIVAGRDININFGATTSNSVYSVYMCKNQIEIISSKIISAELSLEELIQLKNEVIDPYLEQLHKERGERIDKI